MMESFIEHGRKNVNDYLDGNPDLLCASQLCGGTFKTVNSALSEVSAIAHATTAHRVTEETSTLGDSLQEKSSDCECQAAVHTVRYPSLLFMYDCDSVLVEQAPGNGVLQNHVPGILSPRMLYLYHDPTLSGHSGES